jgi:hypothetical protein
MFSGFELGNYFRDWHTLTKAVRDGARFAARNDFSNFDCENENALDLVEPTKEIVRTGLVGGSTDLLPNWDSAEFDLSVTCAGSVTTSDGDGGTTTETMSGIYAGRVDGAPVVTVTVRLPYRGLFGQFGWSGSGLNIAATEQAAVAGV